VRPLPDQSHRRYDGVLFDLLTGRLDSWTLWNAVAESEEAGRRWRAEYPCITYRTGVYRSYKDLVAEAAEAVGGRALCWMNATRIGVT